MSAATTTTRSGCGRRAPAGGRAGVLPIAFGLLLAAGLGAAVAWWGMHRADVPVGARPSRRSRPRRRRRRSRRRLRRHRLAPPPSRRGRPRPRQPPRRRRPTRRRWPARRRSWPTRRTSSPSIASRRSRSVIVLQFPSLAEQGRMLNRVAALIEKAGFPRDRVRATMRSWMPASAPAAATPDTFYYGHDYRAGSSAAVLRSGRRRWR